MTENNIEINQKAPDFTLPDTEGNNVTLSSYQGNKNVVLIMYPGDDTEGCTKQLCAIRDDITEFEKRDTVVLGINHADSGSHQNFIKKYGLKNPLLVDEGRKVITQYGAIKNFMGSIATERSVIIVDKQGTIRYIERGMPEDQVLLTELDKINNQ